MDAPDFAETAQLPRQRLRRRHGSCAVKGQSPARPCGAGVELTMPNKDLLPFQRLDIYIVAKELVRRVHEANIRDTELRDQATRAAKSAFLQLCEGLPHSGVAMRRKYLSGSEASRWETLGAMDLAHTIGASNAEDARDVQRLGVRLNAMLKALLS